MSKPNRNPYVGPRTFEEKDSRYFFGREREARELLSFVISQSLVLFYAQSGAGKSSLLNASLVPGLRQEGFAILGTGRVGGVLPEGVGKFRNIFVFNLLLSLEPGEVDPGRLASTTLADYLNARAKQMAKTEQPRILVIDQFEEISTTYLAHWQEREEFFLQLNQALRQDPFLWVILTMREDHVAALDPYANLLPGNLRARFHMQRMGAEAAGEAIRKPAEIASRPFMAGVAEKLVDELRLIKTGGQSTGQLGQYIEPLHLQVVCYRLWEEISGRPGDAITPADLAVAGDVDTALAGFYEDVISTIMLKAGSQVSESQLRNWISTKLITEAGTRAFVYKGAEETNGLPNKIVEQLQAGFLLRAEPRAGGIWVEIVHDRFVWPIIQANQAWVERHPSTLMAAARVWSDARKAPQYLFRGVQLEEAQAQLRANPDEFPEMVTDFITASDERERRRKELQVVQSTVALENRKYLSESGWGIIFAHDADPQIREALQPLLTLRQSQATLKRADYYNEFIGPDGYRPAETAIKFLTRHGVGPGNSDPALVPYYLLIVGDPESIPFEFQYQLDVERAVGRLHFEKVEEYASYARSVVMAETGDRKRPRHMAVFSVVNPDDQATRLGTNELTRPLIDYLRDQEPSWLIEEYLERDATKSQLASLFGGEETPAFLFTMSRGMEFPMDNDNQLPHTGALLCQEWPGPREWRGQIPHHFYFAADDVNPEADLLGMIGFIFAPSSVGTPRYDDFFKQKFTERKEIAPRAFISRLPQRLLGHPKGGALAIIGHVGTSWGYSFLWQGAGRQIEPFTKAFEQLLNGFPVGAVIEPFNRRYVQLASELTSELLEVEAGKKANDYEMAAMWTSTIDARNYVIFGDPAVRLMVKGLTPDMDSLQDLYETVSATEVLLKEAYQLAREGKVPEAAEKYRLVLESNPLLELDPDLEARRVAASIKKEAGTRLARKGDTLAAAQHFQEALALDPALDLEPEREASRLAAQAKVDLGRATARKGEYETAVEHFAEARSLDPELKLDPEKEAGRLAAPVLVQKGRSLVQSGDAAGALALFNRARQMDPEVGDLEIEARQAEAIRLMEKGQAAAREIKIDKAVALYEQALQLDPSLDIDPHRSAAEIAAQSLVEQGHKLANTGEIDAASELFRQAVNLDNNLSIDPETEAQRIHAENRLYFNGVDGERGAYAWPPVTVEELVQFITGQAVPENLADLRSGYQQLESTF